MADKPYGEMSTEELLENARHYPASGWGAELRAELDRRVSIEQIKAAKAQVWSAWLQGAVVVIMVLTVVATKKW